MKLFDSELKVMDILWKEGDLPARTLAQRLGEQVGWNKNTTYTVIKKCIEKGAVERVEPGFICRALVTREAAQAQEVGDLIDRMFDGSPDMLFASLVSSGRVPKDLIDALRRQVEEAQ